MKIEIFNVDHGQCSVITCPNGKKVMIDAGHSARTPWFPSLEFYGHDIEKLVITNYDEDHTSDLRDVLNNCNVKALRRNPTISAANLRAMKSKAGMGDGIRRVHEYLQWLESLPNGAPVTIDTGGVRLMHSWNSYGSFNDANNLSVATFVVYGNFTMLFPGDLEEAGWATLWQDPSFRQLAAQTNIVLAAHHGRRNGCFEPLFTQRMPQLVIISDSGIEYATQETVDWYYNRTTGVQPPRGLRSVLTTRNDGKITLNIDTAGNFTVQTETGTATSPLASLFNN